MNAQPLEVSFEQAYARLAAGDGALFATAGAGFGRFLAPGPLAQAVAEDRRAVLEFDWAHPQALVAFCFSFELGHQLLGLKRREAQRSAFPLGRMMAFGAWLRFQGKTAWLEGPDPVARQRLSQALAGPEPAVKPPAPLNLKPQLDASAHRAALERTFEWIRQGEVYQLNYTQQLRGTTQARARDAFLPALGADAPAYAALFEAPEGDLLSLSPELLLATEGLGARTEPIKGTRPRGANAAEDQALIQELDRSAKEQAELFMITDLLRNDLGRIAQVGGVKVERAKVIEPLKEVIHSRSVVTARLKPGYAGLAGLLELLPGGSVSGCPKVRALELIEQLERQERGPYTGSLGYRLPGGDLKANVLIRSLLFEGEQVSLGVGGGITIESNPQAELAEAEKKARSVLIRFEAL